ncbi:uncharacterized protein METZ01_LOCUS243852, partial [marine metagenome]
INPFQIRNSMNIGCLTINSKLI